MSPSNAPFIKAINIKNVRGIIDETFEVNLQKNKPTLLIAPNGSGKTSFAVAFNSLTESGIKLQADEYREGKIANKPELKLIMGDGRELSATDSTNSISGEVSFFVLNNKVKATAHSIPMYGCAKARLAIEPIVLVNSIPKKVALPANDLFSRYVTLPRRGRKPYPVDNLIKNAHYLSTVALGDFNAICARWDKIDELLRSCAENEDELSSFFEKVKDELLELDNNYVSISRQVDNLLRCVGDDRKVALLYLIQIVYLYKQDKTLFGKYIKYLEYQRDKEYYNSIYGVFHSTWKSIKAKERKNKLVVEFPSPNLISNGERDILIMFSQLIKFERTRNRENCVLVIDELFDYLDDGNFIAAQYYILKYIEKAKSEGKNIYPIILSHLYPGFYRNFAFKKLNIVYFKEFPRARITDTTKALMRCRELNEDFTDEEFISRYLFHYHPSLDKPIPNTLGGVEIQWATVEKFSLYTQNELKKYLDGGTEKYDPVMVTVELRRIIEKYCYEGLHSEATKNGLLDTHKTVKKIEYACEHGAVVHELFNLLSVVYNEALHCKDDGFRVLQNTLNARLYNNTIKSMIKQVRDICAS